MMENGREEQPTALHSEARDGGDANAVTSRYGPLCEAAPRLAGVGAEGRLRRIMTRGRGGAGVAATAPPPWRPRPEPVLGLKGDSVRTTQKGRGKARVVVKVLLVVIVNPIVRSVEQSTVVRIAKTFHKTCKINIKRILKAT